MRFHSFKAFTALLFLLLLISTSASKPSLLWAAEPDGSASGEKGHLEDDFQLWAPVTLQVNATKKLYGAVTIQPRLSNNWKELTQLISNEMIGYRLTPNIAVELGHEFNNRFDWEEDGTGLEKYIHENRLYEGIVLTRKREKTEWTFRNRLEQRWINGNNGAALRSRHLLGLKYFLGTKKRWYLSASNEIFLNLATVTGDNPSRTGFNQNRAFIGLGKKINDRLTMEGGYLMQYVNNNAPKDDNLNHILQLKTTVQLGKK